MPERIKLIQLSELKANPNNPRVIKDARFEQLCKSIKEFPKMMILRPIIIDAENTIIGGNMRFRALEKLGYTEVEDNWVKKAEDLTEDEKKRFVIEDNLPFGEWDWDILANEYDVEELKEWGMDEKEVQMFIEPEIDEELPEIDIEGQISKGTPYILIKFKSEEELAEFRVKYNLREGARFLDYEQLTGGNDVQNSDSDIQ
jgi:ParB-like chromosome segregation protein Spo0J